ncbi:hypothetical protein [Mucilaginibacter rubeus]|uniref:Uncharacterized protein n=1 Tax=Mucilaginibacter rubeus TaxID=2027860 RepID=A0A5C1I2V6_9SPHI|nr:hypothetical protein [Mucilaginibacter rubeus]QEM11718.1 hypothetical protein DEO27_017350 [Mucilaginibacter rubeus]
MKKSTLFSIFALLILAGCDRQTAPEQLINQKASLPASFKLSDLHEQVITSFMNRKDSTMSVLYGNKEAAARAGRSDVPDRNGLSFTLITWRQQEDPHWFGARIPGDLLSVEQLKVGSGDGAISYDRFSGTGLNRSSDTSGRSARIHFILAQKASVIP